MKKKYLKIITIILFIILFLSMPIISFGSKLDTNKLKNITEVNSPDEVKNFAGVIIYIIQFVGYGVAVIVLLVIRNTVYGS